MASSYTLPMLIAEWEKLGSTEPFPMAAAGMMLNRLNRTATNAQVVGACTCPVCAAAAATILERRRQPPQRYVRKGPGYKMAFSKPMIETEPMGADGMDTGNAKTNTLHQPKGPTRC